jgi:hypothetical protein
LRRRRRGYGIIRGFRERKIESIWYGKEAINKY